MGESPVVKLFGVPELRAPGAQRVVTFTSERPYQILVFLAAAARWVRRDELGGLLWPDRSPPQARSNLRKVCREHLETRTLTEQRSSCCANCRCSASSRFEQAWQQGVAGTSRGGEVRLTFENLPMLLKNLTPARWKLYSKR